MGLRVEALRIENGFFIPMIEQLKKIQQEKILSDIEIVDSFENDPYAPFDKLIGLCQSNISDASVNHDYKVSENISIEKILEMTSSSESWSDAVIKEREDRL